MPTSANLWPLYVAQSKGYFDAADLKLDVVFSQSNASVIQQLAAGSYNIAPSAGIVDPIRAIEKGAPVSIIRILIQSPPYALLAKARDQEHQGPQGQDHHHRRRQGHHPHLHRAHARTERAQERRLRLHLRGRDQRARFSALQSGAVDAAILTVPFNFYAESAGYTNLGFTFDYIPDMPFAAMAVNRNWATANPKVVERFLGVIQKGVTWFEDPANHAEAVKLMVEHSKLKQEDVEKSYEFLRSKHLFEPTGKVSRRTLGAVVDALRELGDIPKDFPVERLVLPGVTQLVD